MSLKLVLCLGLGTVQQVHNYELCHRLKHFSLRKEGKREKTALIHNKMSQDTSHFWLQSTLFLSELQQIPFSSNSSAQTLRTEPTSNIDGGGWGVAEISCEVSNRLKCE